MWRRKRRRRRVIMLDSWLEGDQVKYFFAGLLG